VRKRRLRFLRFDPAHPEALRIPDGVAVVGILMAGHPKYAFKRLPDRDPLRVSWL
jgi:hypothetical protein